MWKKGRKFLILCYSFSLCLCCCAKMEDQLSWSNVILFFFALRMAECFAWFSPSSWPGGSTRKLDEIQVSQILRFRGALQRSGCSSVVHWQVPLNWVVLIWFIPVTEVPANLELFVCVVFAKFPNLLTWTFSSCIPSALTAPFLQIGIHAASPDSHGSCWCISYCRTERRCLYPAVFQDQALRHRATGGDVKGSELDRSHRSGSEWWSIQSDILALIMDSAKCCGGSCPFFSYYLILSLIGV